MDSNDNLNGLEGTMVLCDGNTYEAHLSLTVHAESVMGLDDPGRYPDVYRQSTARWVHCYGTVDALTDLLTELNDRAIEDGDGFGHSQRDRAICRRNVAQIIRKTNLRPRD